MSDYVKVTFKCDHDGCDAIFENGRALKTHVKIHNDESRPFVCAFEGCLSAFKKKHQLAAHMSIHPGIDKPFKCLHLGCDKGYTTNAALICHSRIHVKNFRCEVEGCQSTFSNEKHLQTHQRVHDGLKPFVCDHPNCDMAFSISGNLSKHKNAIHLDIKPFACTYPGCDKNFSDHSHLDIHIRSHVNDHPHKCDYPDCSYASTNSSNLAVHKRFHDGSRPYECDICHAKFVQSGDLASHKRTHTGERPFECQRCDKCFKTSGALQCHDRTHTNSRPYECGECEAAFKTSGDLDRHRRIHTGIRPYVCPHEECDAAFPRTHHLDSHIYFYHTVEGRQRRKRQEERVAKLLSANGIDFKREHHVSFSCNKDTFARVDFVLVRNAKLIILEIDEHQHQEYSVCCDVARVCKIYEALLLDGNSLPVYVIRYNPHDFRINGQTAFVGVKEREKKLINTLLSVDSMVWSGMRCQYLYYDVQDEELVISRDEAFTIKDLCLPTIISA